MFEELPDNAKKLLKELLECELKNDNIAEALREELEKDKTDTIMRSIIGTLKYNGLLKVNWADNTVYHAELTNEGRTYFEREKKYMEQLEKMSKPSVHIGSITNSGVFSMGDIIDSDITIDNSVEQLEKEINEKGNEDKEELLEILQENYDILSSFAYWGLTNFLQVRNPNVPNIPNKLIKKEERNSLSAQRKFWNTAINAGLEVRCLYTNKLLVEREYDLDHFIPWSFVSHDLLWNLMPADSSINSSKSNKLPDLNLYLPKLAETHQAALRINLEKGRQDKLLEDYLSLGHTPQDIVMMDREHLLDCFFQTFTPMNQIALNMGFESWKY